MSLPDVVSPDVWLKARIELLAQEKALLRRRDELNAARRMLPMIRIEKDYAFQSADGTVTLREMFGDKQQLIVQHVMFDPAWDAACSGCTAGIDELSNGLIAHIASRETAFALVSRAPIEKIEKYRIERGWTLPWYSSFGGDFNYDFHVSLDPDVVPVQWNYRDAAELEAHGQGWILESPSEQPGMSCFLREGDELFHTYSTFARGSEQCGGSYGFLDMTALGRQEDWEEPKGRATRVHGADPTFSD